MCVYRDNAYDVFGPPSMRSLSTERGSMFSEPQLPTYCTQPKLLAGAGFKEEKGPLLSNDPALLDISDISDEL